MQAQKWLAIIYYDGLGVPINYPEALIWFKEAAEQGDATSQYFLGIMYNRGQGLLSSNFIEAANWYKKAAEQGIADAQYNLAVMYDEGKGVQQNYTDSFNLYKQSANLGNVYAQYNLGCKYYKGQGVSLDYGEAYKWFMKAANQGYSDAFHNLGVMNYEGQGVPQNFKEAFKWYEKAANQGDANSQYGLGTMYLKGHGVPQNNIKAYMWLCLAAAKGHKSAIEVRNKIAEIMTPVQIEEAQKLAYDISQNIPIKKQVNSEAITIGENTLIPDKNPRSISPKNDTKQSSVNWILWKKTTFFAGSGSQVGSSVSWDILGVDSNREQCENRNKMAQDYFKNKGKEYFPDGTWGQTFHDFYCLPETVDPRDKK